MTCPLCGQPTDRKHRPFCSKRCADLDLARWLNGSYAVPSTDPEDVEEAVEEVLRRASEGPGDDEAQQGGGPH